MCKTLRFMVIPIVALLGGCMTAAQHKASLQTSSENALTVGTVQREIRQGMAGAEVIQALGSPNLVTRDSKGRETWVWDKMSTETAYSKSEGGLNILVLGFVNTAAGGAMGGASSGAGATATTQRTLTVIVKFNEGVVNEFSYHSSSF